ncbi:MFS transporter [Nocardioides sp. HDW12B]|uniref:MFS transporter n=1 Tax=Nocardioides sp. HDW12B TaxID=2714939 RepID=UPI00140B4F9B|nr:MFS transporter [Nocardioides sp. HDW12B]QIK64986.1 MFS transporter [Nocardioides sp. HDW12B]
MSATSRSDAARVAVVLGLLFGLTGMGSAAAAIAVVPMAEAYGVSDGAATWTISLYALMLGIGTAVYGRIADLSGPRTPMTVGITLMSVGALLAALAPSFPIHLVGRLAQGAGAAAVPTLGAAVLSARYSGDLKSTALVKLASIAAAVTSLGPLAGGIVIDTLSWRFAIALPMLGLLVLPFIWHAMHVGGTGARLDFIGAALTALAAGGAVLLVQSPSTGVVVAVAGGLLLALGVPAVIAWVRRHPGGFLPREVIGNPVVVRSAFAAAAVPASWFALLIAVPAVLLDRGWETWAVGLTLVPSGVVSLLMPRVVGPLLTRLEPSGSLMLASVISVGSLGLAGLGAGLGSPPLLVVAVVFVTVAFGIGQPALSAAVGGAVEESVRGVALGVATLVFMVGGSIGSAVVGGLGHVLGLGPAIGALALLPLVGVLVVAPTRRAVSEPVV